MFGWITRIGQSAVKAAKRFGIGVRAVLGGAAPGNWASDHRVEAERYTGWNFIAISAGCNQAAQASVEVYQDDDSRTGRMKRSRRKSLRSIYGSISRYKSLYGGDDRESDPLPQDHPLCKLLKKPNPWESGATFRYRQYQQLRLTGSCYVWNVPGKNNNGRTVQRYVLPTALLTPVQMTSDMPLGGYRLSAAVSRFFPARDADGFAETPLWWSAAGKVIDAREVQVIRLPHPVVLDDGQSPLSAGAGWIDAATQLDVARYSQMLNGAKPSFVMSPGDDVELTPEEADAISAKIAAKYAGAENAGKVIVTNSKTTVTSLTGTAPKEMDYVQSFDQMRGAQLALHHTPAVAVGLVDPGSYAAYNAARKSYRTVAVQPMLDLIAESETETLAPQFGEGLVVEIEADPVDDAELLEKQLANDLAARVRTRNEWRALRGLPALRGPEGDELVGGSPVAMGAGQSPMLPDNAAAAAAADANSSNGIDALIDRFKLPIERLNGSGKSGLAVCSCEYPDVALRNGSGHHPSCDIHKEWEAAGGFGRNGNGKSHHALSHPLLADIDAQSPTNKTYAAARRMLAN